MEENRKLQDEAMAQVSGGMETDEHGMKPYDAYGTVQSYLGDCMYQVLLDDGGEITAQFDERHVVPDGTRVALIALMGSWRMEEIRVF